MNIVYVVTNQVNGKQYVGMTTVGLEARKKKHLYDLKKGSHFYFHRAIKKYGVDAFTWEVAYVGETAEELFEKEIELIAELDTYNNGYNMTLGGEGTSGCSVNVGESHGQAVITEEQAKEVGWLIENTDMTYSDIADEIGCNCGVVVSIGFGGSWRHLFQTPPSKSRGKGVRVMNFAEREQAEKVVDMLHTTNKSYREIALLCGVTERVVTHISLGRVHKHLYDIPPCQNRPSGTRGGYKQIDESKAKEIVHLLQTTTKDYKTISEEVGVTKTIVKGIANGKNWTQLYDSPPAHNRPIGAPKKLNDEEAMKVINMIHNPNKTYKKIAEECGTTEGNVKTIAQGKSFKHLYSIPPAKVRKLRKAWRKSFTDKYKFEIDWSEVS